MTNNLIIDQTAPNRATAMLNGRASGILNWNDIPYPALSRTYKALKANFWVPEEVSLQSDQVSWPTLSDEEQKAFTFYMAMLATLDGPQGRVMYAIANQLTDPAAQANLIFVAQQEVVHNQSYSYVFSSILDWEAQQAAFYGARDNAELAVRNASIMEAYSYFLETPDDSLMLVNALLHSLVLEGIHFYGAFALFYNLARQGKMVGSSTIISYINKDELVHLSAQAEILRAIMGEDQDIYNWVMDWGLGNVLREAVQREFHFSAPWLRDQLDIEEFHGYLKYRANKISSMVGGGVLYEGATVNPMPWINAYADNFDGVKTDFFEQKVRQYSKITEDDGFDDI